MREVTLGDFVETILDINGILIDVGDTPDGKIAYIAVTDGLTFSCLLSILKDCIYK